MPVRIETRRAAKISGKSDIDGIAEALDEGLWDDPLIDPITCVCRYLRQPYSRTLDARQVAFTFQLVSESASTCPLVYIPFMTIGPWAIGPSLFIPLYQANKAIGSDLHETQRWRYIGSLLRRDISVKKTILMFVVQCSHRTRVRIGPCIQF